MTGEESGPDFAHTDQAARMRREKALELARYVWDRGISADELLALPDPVLRKLARAAGVHPPSTLETWRETGELLAQKAAWALRNPAHPSATAPLADEKIMWVKRPVPGWGG